MGGSDLNKRDGRTAPLAPPLPLLPCHAITRSRPRSQPDRAHDRRSIVGPVGSDGPGTRPPAPLPQRTTRRDEDGSATDPLAYRRTRGTGEGSNDGRGWTGGRTVDSGTYRLSGLAGRPGPDDGVGSVTSWVRQENIGPIY